MGHTGSPLLDDRLEQRHHDMISRAMRARLGDPELAQDATQDLLERITRDFERFDPALGTFEHWIMGYVRFTVLEVRRRHRALPIPHADLPEVSVEDPRVQRLPPEWRQGIAALPLRDRRLLFLRVVEGWPAETVGEALGMSATNVTTRMLRISRRIRKRFESAGAA